MTKSATENPTTDAPPTNANQVFLRGRLAAEPDTKDLPSGDVLMAFRLTVPRPPGDRARVDSIECATVRARPRRTLARAAIGDEIEVTGRLHRRFWRTPHGAASRYAVDVETLRVLRGATASSRPQGRSPGRQGDA